MSDMRKSAGGRHRGKRGGFTLIEMVVTICIIGILTAFTAPFLVSYVETGRAINRTNIARTLYLAAQNQLSEKRILKGLESFSHSFFVDGQPNTDTRTMVYSLLGSTFEDLPENKDSVRYISKDKGDTNPLNPVNALLDPVIMDKIILNDAILIEYNIKTGNVLSVFYSEHIDRFDYETTGSEHSVHGARKYLDAEARRQGYYGVGSTGSIADPRPSLIGLKDGYTEPLSDGSGGLLTNVLYADIFLPDQGGKLPQAFDLLINGQLVCSYDGTTDLPKSLSAALLFPSAQLLYEAPLVGVEKGYRRLVWVLDYVGGDMQFENKPHSIVEKLGKQGSLPDGATLTLAPNQNIRVAIRDQKTGAVRSSVAKKNPFFFTELETAYEGGQNKLGSARHLYNARYALFGHLTQIDDIDGKGLNFAPIGTQQSPFVGTFNGLNHSISDLQVGTAGRPTNGNAGLFGTLGSFENQQAKVYSLGLVRAQVYASLAAGSVAGEAARGVVVSGCYVREAQVSGSAQAGGLVGHNAGRINDCSFVSTSGSAPVRGGGSYVGGIVGQNSGGTLLRQFYLAVAPERGGTIYPISGNTSETATEKAQLYYLSGTDIYPEIADGDYNVLPNNGLGEGKGTLDLYEVLPNQWEKNNFDGNEDAMLSLANTQYPYAYFKRSERVLATHQGGVPGWPIALGGTVEADIKVDGFALSQRREFEMPLPATARLSYDRPAAYGTENSAFDACFDEKAIKLPSISSKIVLVENPNLDACYVNFGYDKAMGNGEGAIGDSILWCLVPGLIQEGQSPRQLVFDQLQAANAAHTAAVVKGMNTAALAEALTLANAHTMQQESVCKVPPKSAENPEQNKKYFTLLFWSEHEEDSYQALREKQALNFTISLSKTNDGQDPWRSELRTLYLTPPYFEVLPTLGGKQGTSYEIAKGMYTQSFQLGLNYLGQGLSYLRVKVNEEWLDEQGNILPANFSSYTFDAQSYDNRKHDGYLYLIGTQKGTAGGPAEISVVRRAAANAPLQATQAKITLFVDAVQFNLPYEFWNTNQLPQD